MFNYTDSCCNQTINIHFRSIRKEYRVFCHFTMVIGMYWTNIDLRFKMFSAFNTNYIVPLSSQLYSYCISKQPNLTRIWMIVLHWSNMMMYLTVFLTLMSPPFADTYICLSGQFKCTRKQKCIPLNLRCNGQDDCGDGEDETDCRKQRHDTFCSLH